MAKNNIKLEGRDFILMGDMKRVNIPMVSVNDIYDCYNRPSQTKLSIWNEWVEWFESHQNRIYGVKTYNSNMFTIEGIFYYEGASYYVYITKNYNKAWKLYDR